jgi:Mrp family chromosome partitioning ATPase
MRGKSPLMRHIFFVIIGALCCGFLAGQVMRIVPAPVPVMQESSPVAQAQIIQDQKKLAEIQSALTSPSSDLGFLRNPKNAALFDHAQSLILERESLKNRYGPRHPIMMELDEKISAANTKLNAARREYYTQLESERTSLQARIESTKKMMMTELKAQPRHDTVPIDFAPYFIVIVLFVLVAGATMIARRFYIFSGVQFAETVKPYPVFTIPALPSRMGTRENYVVDFPASPFTEKLRTLRQDISDHTKYTEGHKRAVMIAPVGLAHIACLDVALGIAKLAAREKQRVVIIEANLRDPVMLEILGAQVSHTLTDYLTNRAKLESCVVRTGAHQPHMIYAAAIPATAAAVITSEKMMTLLASLRQMYDLCLIIAPDVTRFSDARILAAQLDAIVTLSPPRTSQFTLEQAVKSFQLLGRKPVLFGLVR